MRYRLRTLLIVLAVGPVFLAACYWGAKEWQRRIAESAATSEMAKARAAEAKELALQRAIDEYLREFSEQEMRIRDEAFGKNKRHSAPNP